MLKTKNQNNMPNAGTRSAKCLLFINMRDVWAKHVWWTREVILAISNSLASTDTSVAKLLENPAEMARVFAPYYPHGVIMQIEQLFTTHLKQGGDIVTAAKNGDTAKVNQLQIEWHKNSDQIAKLFASINPFYNESEVRNMMYSHLSLTTNEATLYLQTKYDDAIKAFDQIQAEAAMMADYFAVGIIKQFPRRF